MKSFLLVLLLLLPSASFAVIETYEFDSEQLSVRYHAFTDELRCPKCQNQNLSGSDSPIAADLRRELHQLLQDGKSDKEIIDFMVDRYGDFVLYRPQFNAETAVLWLAPAILLLLGMMVLAAIIIRQRRGAADDGLTLAESERKALEKILKEEGSND
jgi:cytochrome c-type biogenesis protein CcmH